MFSAVFSMIASLNLIWASTNSQLGLNAMYLVFSGGGRTPALSMNASTTSRHRCIVAIWSASAALAIIHMAMTSAYTVYARLRI